MMLFKQETLLITNRDGIVVGELLPGSFKLVGECGVYSAPDLSEVEGGCLLGERIPENLKVKDLKKMGDSLFVKADQLPYAVYDVWRLR